MRSAAYCLLVTIACWLAGPAVGQAEDPIPAHPDGLVYPSLEYTLPPAEQFREVLSNGMVVYIAEDRMLPTLDISVSLRAGGAFDPPGREGLASLACEQLRDGGTQKLTPEELDERIEFLAATLSTQCGDTSGTAVLSCLSKDVDEALGLLIDVLRHPRYDEERLRKAKERRLQNVKRRNDRTSTIEQIEWGFLMNGEGHFSNEYPSTASIEAITRDDLLAFHRRCVHPGNLMLAVSGDFDRAAMLARLERAFSGWPAGEPAPKTFPAPQHSPAPGVYVIHKDGVNQGRVSLGHGSVLRGTPDEFALRIMNGILGAAGFQSRLAANVRSDQGLAYSVGSSFGQGVYYPDDFRCYVQSKTNACAFAIRLIIDEIRRMQNEKVSQEELDNAIAYYVESFPQAFPTKLALMQTYLSDEYTGRDPSYWQGCVEKLESVTAEDVQRVARQYLHPDELVILAVGDADGLVAGGHDKAPELTLEAFGPVIRLPLRDPDTLKR